MRLTTFEEKGRAPFSTAHGYIRRKNNQGIGFDVDEIEFDRYMVSDGGYAMAWIVLLENSHAITVVRVLVHPLMLLDCNQARLCKLAHNNLENLRVQRDERGTLPTTLFAGNYEAFEKFVEERHVHKFIE